MLAVDPQRAGEAERHLRHAGEVLDVAFGGVGVEREVADVLGVGAGVLADEALPLLDDGVAVVVFLAVGDADAVVLLGHRVLHLEPELAEVVGAEDHDEIVAALIERCVAEAAQLDGLAQREGDG